MDKLTIITCWEQVFHNSCASVTDGCLGSGIYVKGYLAKDKTEWTNGISHNDPLNYMASLEGEIYKELDLGLSIKPPEGSHIAFGSAKLRKVTIKNATPEKLVARFKAIREFVMANAQNMHRLNFDISTK